MADAAFELFVLEPLYGVACTVVAYVAASALYEKLGRPSPLHPVLIAMLGLGGFASIGMVLNALATVALVAVLQGSL